MKNTKKIISLLLSVLMIITSVPLMAVESFAADPVKSGTTGDCTWTLDSDGVLTISGNGRMGYYNNSSPWGTLITKAVIENGVTSIGRNAFYNCTLLTTVVIPDSVTSIYGGAFSCCTSLVEINVGSENAKFSSENGVLFNKDKTKLITYPSGKKDEFYVIPDSVTSIGDSAFRGCTSLTSVTIPDSVISIGGGAFSRCTSLTSINIPDGVTSIGGGTFSECTSLTDITIPDSVTSIDSYAFYGSAYYGKDSNWDNGILYIGNHLIKAKENVSGNVEIRQGTKTIAGRAFSGCTSLTSVTIGNGVKSIGNSAFSGCTSLTSITIPDSVTSVGGQTFENCTSLTSINIPNSVIDIGYGVFRGCNSIKTATINSTAAVSAFKGNASIENIIIGDGVTSIGDEAFWYCPSLTSITIRNGVTSIGGWAFANCTSLTSVTIPDSVTSIGGYAFNNTAYYNNESNWDNGILYIGNHLIKAKENVSGNVEIWQGTKTIADSAFVGCSLTSINFPDCVTSIGEYAFRGCTSLKSITIPDGVTSIGNKSFLSCTSLASITIPDSVTSIGDEAFHNCKSLTSITIPNSVTSIGMSAFSYCTSLASITIPDGVTSIGRETFSVCTSLTSVNIPDSVTEIGEGAFYYCTSLTSVTIPNSVTEIGDKAFGYYYDSIENKYKAVGGFTIYGYQGSAAEKYAKDNGFEFLPMASTNELLLISVTKMPTKTEYYVGDTLDTTGLEITAKYTDNTEKVITSDLTITGFNSSTAGTKTVTVDYKGKTATFNVKVVKPSIIIANNSLSFDSIGSTKSLTVTTTPSDQKIAWSSSNKNVATVSDGVVTAKGAGNATITAQFTYNNIEYTATCNVTVEVPTVPTVTFPDVASNDWYSNAVKFNAEKGYVTGYSNGTFGPSNNIQRQDFVLILARIAGADLSAYEGQNGGFSDVQAGAYYASAVAWAKDKGVVTGYSADNFGVGTYITREQISLILCRYLNGSASGNVDAILNAYSDGGNTSPWAKAGVAWAVENGIIGNSDYLNPNGNAGRAEVAQIIYNMSNKGML